LGQHFQTLFRETAVASEDLVFASLQGHAHDWKWD